MSSYTKITYNGNVLKSYQENIIIRSSEIDNKSMVLTKGKEYFVTDYQLSQLPVESITISADSTSTIVTSQNGTKFLITIDDNGNLSTQVL